MIHRTQYACTGHLFSGDPVDSSPVYGSSARVASPPSPPHATPQCAPRRRPMRAPSPPEISLRTACGPLRLRSPIINASGTMGWGYEYARHLVSYADLGAFVFKGVTRSPSIGNTRQRVHTTARDMINSVGLQNPGIDAFTQKTIPMTRRAIAKNMRNKGELPAAHRQYSWRGC